VNSSRGRAVVVGGSIGGLTAALLLRDAGFDVDVFERTPGQLEGRGSGIVLQPETLRWFRTHSSRRPDELATVSRVLRCLGANDEVVYEEPVEWRFTSWGTLYGALLADFGEDRYHYGETLVGLDQDADSVAVRFASGQQVTADLAVFADGVTSVARRQLLPEVSAAYSGYVGWRGTVPEMELDPQVRALLGDSLTYALGPNTHICLYPIPGPDAGIEHGRRLMNYVWYRNVESSDLDDLMTDKAGVRGEVSLHPGRVQERFIAEMKAAAWDALAPAAAGVVNATAQPYLQPILDVDVPRLAFGRAVLLGDAGFAARPHAAAGTAKAAAEAWALAEHLQAASSIPEALQAWEPEQLAVGKSLMRRVAHMGERAQFECSWRPEDPTLRFGLREGALSPSWD
jgi:2,6-dihydroxypyridine 3-monooxygenase